MWTLELQSSQAEPIGDWMAIVLGTGGRPTVRALCGRMDVCGHLDWDCLPPMSSLNASDDVDIRGCNVSAISDAEKGRQ
jgi:hypothetical protein